MKFEWEGRVDRLAAFEQGFSVIYLSTVWPRRVQNTLENGLLCVSSYTVY